MKLQKAEAAESEEIRKFYFDVIDAMQNKDFSIGWKKGIYPDDDYIRESIQKGELYTLRDSEKLSACMVLNTSFNDGYVGLTWSRELKDGEFLVPHALAVAGNMQGRGIGKLAVREIIYFARKNNKKAVRLDIVSSNSVAEKLYTSMGFSFVEETDMYYVDTGTVKYKMYELNFQ